MKNYLILVFFLPVTLFLSPCHAQESQRHLNEFYIGDGAISYDQGAGVLGQMTPATGIISFPSHITGAAFFSYRHYFSQFFAVGVTAGLDNQKGDLSYGKDGYYGNYGASGHYQRNVYTAAAEVMLVYNERYRMKTYGYIGAGYTSTQITFHFFDNIPYRERFYGTGSSLFAHNNTTVDFSHFNFQVTPIGFRTGKALAAFIEFGFGYKGIVHGGVSYGFGRHYATHSDMIDKGKDGMIMLPLDFPVDSSLQELGEVISSNPRHRAGRDINRRVARMSAATNEKGGNVFTIKEIMPIARKNIYDMRGEAYHTDSPAILKERIKAARDKNIPMNRCAYIVVYRSAFFKDVFSIPMRIVDTTVSIDANTTSIFKVTKEGKVRLGKWKEAINVKVHFGHMYYLKLENKRRASLDKVDTVTGVIESGATARTIYYDLQTHRVLSVRDHEPKQAKMPVAVQDTNVVFVTGDYPPDGKWIYKGVVKCGRQDNTQRLSLQAQMNILAQKAMADSANVVQIVGVAKLNGKDCYWLKGKVWHVDDLNPIRAAMKSESEDEVADENHVNVIVYRSEKTPPAFLTKVCALELNGAYRTVIKKNSRYVYRIPGDGALKLTLSGRKIINIDVKRGNTYYFRILTSKKQCKIEQVDATQGALESGITKNVTVRNVSYDYKPDEK